ncbi:hypothetical protein KC685_03810 [Candidatus Dojkabacteria bacterium]|uniref:Uncharacterized protein n=1 Tax=Candidatus Dojkabacteria bacterium TaxID=2099670 RepID=A0A955I372_9BACT|nr:hypothetical protein [Candidatus Dojkabacteria bacterium]
MYTMFSSNTAKNRYTAQVLAVVLVVIVVGVIIALALISRTMGNSRRVEEERSSGDSIRVADTVLDSIKDITLDDLATWGNQQVSPCTDGNFTAYNFLTDGCELNGLLDFESFTSYFGLDEYYSSVEEALLNECGYADIGSTLGGFKLSFQPVGDDDPIEVDKDTVFAFIPGADPNSACTNIIINAQPIAAGNEQVGVVYIPLYVQLDTATGQVSAYKPHEYDDIVGQCVNTAASCSPPEWVGWEDSDTQYVAPLKKTYSSEEYALYEMRIRPIGGDVSVTRSYLPDGCGGAESTLFRVSTTINCSGNSRGKEFIISDQEWAPAIFDYVLFNGQGTLENR